MAKKKNKNIVKFVLTNPKRNAFSIQAIYDVDIFNEEEESIETKTFKSPTKQKRGSGKDSVIEHFPFVWDRRIFIEAEEGSDLYNYLLNYPLCLNAPSNKGVWNPGEPIPTGRFYYKLVDPLADAKAANIKEVIRAKAFRVAEGIVKYDDRSNIQAFVIKNEELAKKIYTLVHGKDTEEESLLIKTVHDLRDRDPEKLILIAKDTDGKGEIYTKLAEYEKLGILRKEIKKNGSAHYVLIIDGEPQPLASETVVVSWFLKPEAKNNKTQIDRIESLAKVAKAS